MSKHLFYGCIFNSVALFWFSNMSLKYLGGKSLDLSLIRRKNKCTAKIQEQINPESMRSQPSRTQVTEQQPVVSLKSKSVFLQISLITFYDRRKGHVHKQETFDINFIVFQKLLISDFHSTSQGCQQSCHACQKVIIYTLLSDLFLCKNHASILRIPNLRHHTFCHLVCLTYLHSKKLSNRKAIWWLSFCDLLFFYSTIELWVRYYTM